MTTLAALFDLYCRVLDRLPQTVAACLVVFPVLLVVALVGAAEWLVIGLVL